LQRGRRSKAISNVKKIEFSRKGSCLGKFPLRALFTVDERRSGSFAGRRKSVAQSAPPCSAPSRPIGNPFCSSDQLVDERPFGFADLVETEPANGMQSVVQVDPAIGEAVQREISGEQDPEFMSSLSSHHR
jgi:hypothetical protein